MNPDDFEKRLQRQPLRPAPAEWREQILSAATPRQPKPIREESVPLWQWIFGRYPVASAAFAGFWLLLLAANALVFGGSSGSSSAGPALARSNEPSSIWRLQSEELQKLASGDNLIIAEPSPNPPAPTPNRPHSELRREDQGVSEFPATSASQLVA